MTIYRMLFASLVFLSPVPAISSADEAAAPKPPEFHVVFDRAVFASPFTGRVYILLSAREPKQLPSGPNWFAPEPFFAVDVKDWRPGETLAVGADALGFPAPLSKLKPGAYYVQAVMDFDCGGRSFAAAEGNGYSRPVRADLDPRAGGLVALTVDQVYHAKPFPETDRVKLVDIESKLLTTFFGRPTRLRAGVVLPESFAKDPQSAIPSSTKSPASAARTSGRSTPRPAKRRTWPASKCSTSYSTRVAGSAIASSPTRPTTGRAAKPSSRN